MKVRTSTFALSLRLFVFVVCFILACDLVAQPHSFNPNRPPIHDPAMAQQDGILYLLGTGHGLQVMQSTDKKTWTPWGKRPFVAQIPSWTRDSVPGFFGSIWAPDIIFYRNRWWLTYSCSTFGKNTSAIALASTERIVPNGDGDDAVTQWKDEGPLICSKQGRDNWNAIDPNIVIDDEGCPWLTFGSFWDGIQVVRLDTTMHIASNAKLKTIARHYSGSNNAIEAPFIYRHDGWYYLFVSWDLCCRGKQSTYKVAVGRSTKPDGPYVDKQGKDMLQGGGSVIFEGDGVHFIAAGHCAIYSIDNVDIFICHGYSYEDNGQAVLVYREIEWEEDEGWPQIKEVLY